MSDEEIEHVECRCAECEQVKAYRAELAERRVRLQAEADGKPSLAEDAPSLLRALRKALPHAQAHAQSHEDEWSDPQGAKRVESDLSEGWALLARHGLGEVTR